MPLPSIAEQSASVFSDSDLLRAWSAGNVAAYETIVGRYLGLVFARCRRALGEMDADDATQAVFLVLARRREQAAASPVLAAWLLRVAENVIRRALRDRQRRRHAERAITPPSPAESEPAMSGFQDHLDSCLAELPAAERDAITLHHLAGMTLAEVATHTDAGVSTVKDRLKRGLDRLRTSFAARGLTLSVPLLLSCLAAEAHAAVPQALLATLTPHPSAVSPRAQRWSRDSAIPMARIAAILSVLVLAVGGMLAVATLRTTPRDLAPASQPAPQPVVANAGDPPPARYLDPEHARSWYALRWNDGQRTAERLRGVPEFVLLGAEGEQILQQVASMQRVDVVIAADAQTPKEKRIERYRQQEALIHLPPAEQVARMRDAIEGGTPASGKSAVQSQVLVTPSTTRPGRKTLDVRLLATMPLPGIHGDFAFASATAPVLLGICQVLPAIVPLLGIPVHEHAGGWFLGVKPATGAAGCHVTVEQNHLRLRGTGEAVTAAQRQSSDRLLVGAADITCVLMLDRGLPGVAHDSSNSLQLTVTDEGLRLSTLSSGWETPEARLRAQPAPRLDLQRFAALPASAILAGAVRMTPGATRDSAIMQLALLSADQSLTSLDDQAITRRAMALLQAIQQIDGDLVCWLEPGLPLPQLTIEADLPPDAGEALLAGLDLPRAADGSISQQLGPSTLHIAWRAGRLICTTTPGGIDAIDRSGGFLDQPDVRRGVAALPTRTPSVCVLMRPAAFANTVAPYVSMLSPAWLERIQAYEQRLASAQAYGYFVGYSDAQGLHGDAAGLLSLIAGAFLATQANGALGMARIAN